MIPAKHNHNSLDNSPGLVPESVPMFVTHYQTILEISIKQGKKNHFGDALLHDNLAVVMQF